MNKKRLVFAFGLITAMGLVACGENGTTETIVEKGGMDIVASAADLPKCTAENEGDQVWVKEKGAASICVAGRWEPLGGSGVTASDYGCETKPLADNRGVAIYCGGDSIGVVLNGDKGERGEQGIQGVAGEKGKTGAAGADGKDGADGKPGEKGETGAQGIQGEQGVAGADGKDGAAGKDGVDGVGCKVVGQTAESVTIQCGDDRFSMNLNGGSAGDIIEEDPGVSLAMLKGVSQKGPYINGASVTLFELDGSKSLMQTGRTFGGEIISNDGRFSVNNVTLNSSYVRLTANGFYRNEVSGENTTSALTLNAYSDLKRRTSVNINLLTHLEYYRVGYLMENSDGSLTITAAKKQAQHEIFQQFHISNEGFKNSEDMDVFGSSEGDAALLAISVLLQGDRNVTELTSLLSDFGTKIAEKGEWKDPVTRAKIADWAYRTSLGMNGNSLDTVSLKTIQENVKGWSLGTVPAFEKYVSNFWHKEYGIGECSADNQDEHKALSAANSSSNKSKTLICDKIRSKNSGYFKDYEWREAIGIEKDHVHACNSDRNKVEKYAKDGYWYECDASENAWNLSTEVKMLNQEKPGTKVGEYIDGSGETRFNGNNTVDSVYEWNGSSWKLTDNVGWYTHRFKDVEKIEGQYEPAKIAGTSLGVVYEGGKWREAIPEEMKFGKGCTAAIRNKFVSLDPAFEDEYYRYTDIVCDTAYGSSTELDWRPANEMEIMMKESCTYAKENFKINKTIGYETYNFTCESAHWTGTGKVTYAGQDYKTVVIGDQYWFAENLNYDPGDVSDMGEMAWSGCYDDEPDNCDKYGRLYTWDVALMVCPEGWLLPTYNEFLTLLSVTGEKIRANNWLSNDDEFGFSLLPAGSRYNYLLDLEDLNSGVDLFDGQGSYANLWSSTRNGGNIATRLDVGESGTRLDEYGRHYDGKLGAISVRCLKRKSPSGIKP